MSRFAVLTLVGSDRPGIVARVSRVLFETGCNIEDSSMTRLCGQFSIMLILRLSEQQPMEEIDRKMAIEAAALELTWFLKEIDLVASPHVMAQESGSLESNDLFMVNLVGGDRPGIIYRVTTLLADQGANICDLRTYVVGTATQPVYIMNIEVTLDPATVFATLAAAIHQLSVAMGVEITIQPLSADPF
ncbi:MAG: hypothetical protein HQL58_01795 [Magnetococcales bacterium]|nr:hypothetical protein [Magnetococcales bacterium]